jgi:hypothetical protein
MITDYKYEIGELLLSADGVLGIIIGRGLNERWQRKHYRVDWTNGKFRNKAYPEEDVEYYKWMLEEYKLEKAQPQSR